MKFSLWVSTTAAVLFLVPGAKAQVPAGATGQCTDGTYTTAAKKAGACRGHKGVGSWYAVPGAMPAQTSTAPASSQPGTTTAAPTQRPTAAAPAAPVVPATQASMPPKTSQAAARQQAPGGGAGLVWVNTSSKVYHCSGTEYYGKTKNGKYLSEAAAKAEGDRADHGKACSQ